jgi:hypothetical protein
LASQAQQELLGIRTTDNIQQTTDNRQQKLVNKQQGASARSKEKQEGAPKTKAQIAKS